MTISDLLHTVFDAAKARFSPSSPNQSPYHQHGDHHHSLRDQEELESYETTATTALTNMGNNQSDEPMISFDAGEATQEVSRGSDPDSAAEIEAKAQASTLVKVRDDVREFPQNFKHHQQQTQEGLSCHDPHDLGESVEEAALNLNSEHVQSSQRPQKEPIPSRQRSSPSPSPQPKQPSQARQETDRTDPSSSKLQCPQKKQSCPTPPIAQTPNIPFTPHIPHPAPSGFQLTGAIKESHGHPIYCVSWSPYLHAKESPGNSNNNRDHELVSYFATCAGPYATIYEVVVPSTQLQYSHQTFNANGHANERDTINTWTSRHDNKTKRTKVPSPIVRQVFKDVDDGENFYTCAFGGRGVDVGGIVNGGSALGDSMSIIHFGDKPSINNESTGEKPSGKRQKLNNSNTNPFPLPSSSSKTGPPLLCLAGTRSTIKIIDTSLRSLTLTLSGHGDEINDMKFSPTNVWLLLTASKDESIRLWNVKIGVNIAIFTGHEGHRGQVLSVDWHWGGGGFVSSGMDNMIKLWRVFDSHDNNNHNDDSESNDVTGGTNEFGEGEVYDVTEESYVQRAVRESFQVAPEDSHNYQLQEAMKRGRRMNFSKKLTTVYQQFPYFSTDKVHTDYVDCVQFMGDLILSKSVHNVIVLWKPIVNKNDIHFCHVQSTNSSTSTTSKTFGTSSIAADTVTVNSANDQVDNTENSHRIPSAILFLREFALQHCDSWFVRFHSSPPYHRLLALGNQKGQVKVWEIGGNDEDDSGYHPFRKYLFSLSTGGIGSNGVASVGKVGGSGEGNGDEGGDEIERQNKTKSNSNNGADNGGKGSTVRMVTFSPHCISLVAVCDDSTVWKWDSICSK